MRMAWAVLTPCIIAGCGISKDDLSSEELSQEVKTAEATIPAGRCCAGEVSRLARSLSRFPKGPQRANSTRNHT